jgi:hypothetical protein
MKVLSLDSVHIFAIRSLYHETLLSICHMKPFCGNERQARGRPREKGRWSIIMIQSILMTKVRIPRVESFPGHSFMSAEELRPGEDDLPFSPSEPVYPLLDHRRIPPAIFHFSAR